MENSVKLVLDKHLPDAGPIKASGFCNFATIQKAAGQKPIKSEETEYSFEVGVAFFFFLVLYYALLWVFLFFK